MSGTININGKQVTIPNGLTPEQQMNLIGNLADMDDATLDAVVNQINAAPAINPIESNSNSPIIREKKIPRKVMRELNPENKDLWTVRQLRKYAAGRHIPEYWKLSKTDLLSKLKGI